MLSLYVYDVRRKPDNRPNLPTGWTLLESKDDNLLGFSYGVFKRSGTNEIVVAYTGTNEKADWVSNITAGLGLPSWQVANAALVYQQVKEKYGSNITLSGHSLGGGLASVMAVWFDRPATVFDEAPFELTAQNPAFTANAGGVNITGSATQGQTLTATNTVGEADGLGAMGYQWKADGIAIAGATVSNLILAEAQVGKAITVVAIGLAADFLNGNIPLATGSASSQALEATRRYQRVRAETTLSDNSTITGHSLGGGFIQARNYAVLQ